MDKCTDERWEMERAVCNDERQSEVFSWRTAENMLLRRQERSLPCAGSQRKRTLLPRLDDLPQKEDCFRGSQGHISFEGAAIVAHHEHAYVSCSIHSLCVNKYQEGRRFFKSTSP